MCPSHLDITILPKLLLLDEVVRIVRVVVRGVCSRRIQPTLLGLGGRLLHVCVRSRIALALLGGARGRCRGRAYAVFSAWKRKHGGRQPERILTGTALGARLDRLELLAVVDALLEFLGCRKYGAEVVLEGVGRLGAVEGAHHLVVFHGKTRLACAVEDRGYNVRAEHLVGSGLGRHCIVVSCMKCLRWVGPGCVGVETYKESICTHDE